MKTLFDLLFKTRLRRGLVLVLSLLVTFTTTYLLVLPAITLEKDVAEAFSGLSLSSSARKGEASASAGESGTSRDSDASSDSDSPSDSDSEGGGESRSDSEGASSAEGETAQVQGETVQKEDGGVALSFDAETTAEVDGESQTVQVHVETSPDAFPEGTTMTVEAVTDQKVLDTISDGVEGEVAGVSAVNVTFTDEDGKEITPQEGHTLSVTLSSDAVTSEGETTVVQYTQPDESGEAAPEDGAPQEAVQELEPLTQPESPAETADEAETTDEAETGSGDVTFETTDPSVFALVEKTESGEAAQGAGGGKSASSGAKPEKTPAAAGEPTPSARKGEDQAAEKPQETPPAEEKPEETKPAQPETAGTGSAADKTEATTPQEAKPVEPTPEASKPEETKPDEPQTGETQPGGAETGDPAQETGEPAQEEPPEVPEEEEVLTPMETLTELVQELELVTLEATTDDDDPVTVRAEFFSDVFPEGVELVVRRVELPRDDADAAIDAAESVEGSVPQVMALDITFLSDGEEVQPEGAVRLTIQAPFLETASASDVVHMDPEGGSTLMESASQEDDAITLHTDSFSVYAIVYTVDFHYNDYTYNLLGGGSIRLSRLLELLEIPVELSQVAEVTFSNPELVEVSYQQPTFGIVGDWLLVSLAPFTSQESLTITLTDGSSFQISITDDQSVPVDITPTLRSVVINVDGKLISSDDWGELVKGKRYALTFRFQETDDVQFSDDETVMVYQLPEGLTAVDKQNASFTMSLGAWGELPDNHYDVRDGKLYVRWNTTHSKFPYLQADDMASLRLDVDVYFDGSASQFRFSDTIQKTVDVHEPHDISVKKSGRYDEAAGKVFYTVTLNSVGGSTGIQVADVISGTALSFDQSSVVVKKNGQVFSVPEGKLVTTGNSFTLSDMTMADKETMTVEYAASVDYSKLTKNGQMTYSESANTVNLRADQDDDPDNNTSQTYGHNVRLFELYKEAGNFGPVVEKDGKKYREVPWTIHSNGPKKTAVSRITDTMDSSCTGFADYSGEGITVLVSLPNGSTVTRTLKWNGSSNSDANGTLTLAADGNSWTYRPPASDGMAAYTISYTTQVEIAEVDHVLKNKVTDDKGDQDTKEKRIPGEETDPGTEPGEEVTPTPTPTPAPKIYKNATYHDTEYADWTITFYVPAEGYDSVSVRERLPNHWVNSLHKTVFDALDPTYGDGGFVIENLLDGESYTISQENNGIDNVITFYQDAAKQKPGLKGTGDVREVVIKVRTLFNEDWIADAAANSGELWRMNHQNVVEIDVNGRKGSDDDTVTYSNVKVSKSLIDGPVEIPLTDGTKAKVYRYEVLIDGITEDGFELFDTFDTSLLRYVTMEEVNLKDWEFKDSTGKDSKPGGIYAGSLYYWHAFQNAFVTATATPNGVVLSADSLPKDEDGKLFPRYRFVYFLAIRDEAKLKERAMNNNGTAVLNNTATYRDVSSNTVETKYEYQVLDKENVGSENGNRRQHFKIVINPDRLTLNNGQDMTLTDTFSKTLSIEYDTIKVTTNPANTPVSYDYRGQTGTFVIPDKTGVVIDYWATVIGNGMVEFSNTAILNDYYTDEVSQVAEQNASLVGESSVFGLRLYKYPAGHMEQFLPGAVFRILDSNKNPITVTRKAESAWGKAHVGQQITFTSTEDGVVNILLSRYEHGTVIRKNTPYYLEEIQAPPGYQRDYTLYSFIISDDPDYEAPSGYYVYHNADILKIRNWPGDNETRLIISKRFLGNEELTEAQKNKLSFEITGSNGFSKTVFYSDFEEGVYTLEGLKPATYTVTEKGAKEAVEGTGYKVDVVTTYKVGDGEEKLSEQEDASASLTLAEGDDGAVSFTNEYSTHGLEITKVDGASDQPLRGAEFSVYDLLNNTGGKPVHVYTTGYDGKLAVRFKDGWFTENTLYYITETKAPEGYVLPQAPPVFFFYFYSQAETSSDMPANAVNLSWDDKLETIENGAVTELTVKKQWQDQNGDPIQMDSDLTLSFELWRVPKKIKLGADNGAVSEHDHTYSAVVTAPTCTEKGYTTHTCACGDSYVDTYVDALGHDFAGHQGEQTVVAPTCTEGGYASRTCTRCGQNVKDNVTEPLGHDWGDWTVTTPATGTKAGVETRTCSRCHETETREIPATSDSSAEYTVKIEYGQWNIDHLLFEGKITEGSVVEVKVTTPGTPVGRTYPLNSESNYNNHWASMSYSDSSNNVYTYEFKITETMVFGVLTKYWEEDKTEVTYTIHPPSDTGGQTAEGLRTVVQPTSVRAVAGPSESEGLLTNQAGDMSAQAMGQTAQTAEPVTQAQMEEFLEQGELVKEFTLSAGDNWTRTIGDLPVKSGGVAYSYYVLEKTGSGYRVVDYVGEGTKEVTVTNRLEDVSFTFSKSWYGFDQTTPIPWPTDPQGAYIPLSVTVRGTMADANNVIYVHDNLTPSYTGSDCTVVNVENRYTFTFHNLQAGYTYTVTEAVPEGYHAVYVLANGTVEDQIITWTDDGGTIRNLQDTYSLPATGGSGTTSLCAAGAVLAVTAVLGLGWRAGRSRFGP